MAYSLRRKAKKEIQIPKEDLINSSDKENISPIANNHSDLFGRIEKALGVLNEPNGSTFKTISSKIAHDGNGNVDESGLRTALKTHVDNGKIIKPNSQRWKLAGKNLEKNNEATARSTKKNPKSINSSVRRLPTDPLLIFTEVGNLIFSYLDCKDLCNSALVNQKWKKTANDSSLWKRLFDQQGWHYSNSDKERKINWKNEFAKNYETKKKLEKHWKKAEVFLGYWAKYLNPPATKEELAETEAKFGIVIPNDLRSCYLIHNGVRIYNAEDYGEMACSPWCSFYPLDEWTLHTEKDEEEEDCSEDEEEGDQKIMQRSIEIGRDAAGDCGGYSEFTIFDPVTGKLNQSYQGELLGEYDIVSRFEECEQYITEEPCTEDTEFIERGKDREEDEQEEKSEEEEEEEGEEEDDE